jgi:hypothetical protein
MTHEIAGDGVARLTFLSRFSALALLAGLVAGGCSKTGDDQSGSAGQGGVMVGSGGAITGASGNPGGPAGAGGVVVSGGGGAPGCSSDIADPRPECAPTYDQQTTSKRCSGTTYKGQCGSGWAWTCQGQQPTFTCFYDQNKQLVRAQTCNTRDTVNFCQQCDVGSTVDCQCNGIGITDGKVCDIRDVGRPATGCASSGTDGVDCCGDGKLPPSGPPFNCTTLDPERIIHCEHGGVCNGLYQVSQVGYAWEIACVYDQGVLAFAYRCDNTGAPFCGASCIGSAKVGSTQAGSDQLCDGYRLPNICIDPR